jgi:hypothetical protein
MLTDSSLMLIDYDDSLLYKHFFTQALGCILYTLCFLAHPFQDMGSLGILSARISMPANVPLAPEVTTMLMRMLDVSQHYNINDSNMIMLILLSCRKNA